MRRAWAGGLSEFTIRTARTPDMRGIHRLLARYVQRRILLCSDLVVLYESVQQILVGEDAAGRRDRTSPLMPSSDEERQPVRDHRHLIEGIMWRDHLLAPRQHPDKWSPQTRYVLVYPWRIVGFADAARGYAALLAPGDDSFPAVTVEQVVERAFDSGDLTKALFVPRYLG